MTDYLYVGRNIRVRMDFTIEIWRWAMFQGFRLFCDLRKFAECTPGEVSINLYYTKALRTPFGNFGLDDVGMGWERFCALLGLDRLDTEGAEELRTAPSATRIGTCYILGAEVTQEASGLIYPFTAFARIECSPRPAFVFRWGNPRKLHIKVTEEECLRLKSLIEGA